jgi:hypothetical protein
MTTASRSLATALLRGALRERLALPSYTTTWDTTGEPALAGLQELFRPAVIQALGYRLAPA